MNVFFSDTRHDIVIGLLLVLNLSNPTPDIEAKNWLIPVIQSQPTTRPSMHHCKILDINTLTLLHRPLTGLSIPHVRRPGLSNLAPGLASSVLNKSGLVCPYLTNQWSQNKV